MKGRKGICYIGLDIGLIPLITTTNVRGQVGEYAKKLRTSQTGVKRAKERKKEGRKEERDERKEEKKEKGKEGGGPMALAFHKGKLMMAATPEAEK
jgi:hypothetical protein